MSRGAVIRRSRTAAGKLGIVNSGGITLARNVLRSTFLANNTIVFALLVLADLTASTVQTPTLPLVVDTNPTTANPRSLAVLKDGEDDEIVK